MLDLSMLGGLPQFSVDPTQGNLSSVPWSQRKGGFVDKFNTMLNPYGGLLGEDSDLVRNQGLLGLASGLLAASGPSTTPVSLGQALGQGLQGMQQGQAGAANTLMAAQRGRQPTVREFNEGNEVVTRQLGSDGQWQEISRAPRWNPQQLSGRDSYFTPVQTAEGIYSFNARTGQAVPLQVGGRQILGATSDPTLQGQLAGAKKGAQVQAEAQTQAALDLPKAQASADQTIKLIDQLRNHPGREMATGTSSALPLVPGTAAKDFSVMLDQVKGKQFLEAYQTLKGGGQITQVEGDKAQAAIARMDRAQSEGEFLKALDDFESAVRVGMQKLAEKAGQPSQQPTQQPPRRRKFNPATGKIE